MNDKSNDLFRFLLLEQPWRMPGHLLDSLECVKVKSKKTKEERGDLLCQLLLLATRMHAWPGFACLWQNFFLPSSLFPLSFIHASNSLSRFLLLSLSLSLSLSLPLSLFSSLHFISSSSHCLFLSNYQSLSIPVFLPSSPFLPHISLSFSRLSLTLSRTHIHSHTQH